MTYKYLQGEHQTSGTDANGVTYYEIDLTQEQATEDVGMQTTKSITYHLLVSDFEGEGTIALQFSNDNGLTWSQYVDSTGNDVIYTIDGNIDESFIDYVCGGTSQRWYIDGDNTDGNIVISYSRGN
jgi:hypothetical protein